MEVDKIAIVILNYNTFSDCKKCLSFIKKQQKVNFEIIIVDNHSDDENALQLNTLCKVEKCTLLKSGKNCGYSAGNNIGLRYAASKGCKFALVINPDVELVQSDYLCKMVDSMIEDNTIAVLGSDIVNAVGQHQNPMRMVKYWEEVFWPIDSLLNIFRKNIPYVINNVDSGYFSMLSGCCFLIRISFLETIGFLDENTFLYCEEPILAALVQKENLKMYYRNDIQAIHRHIKSTKGDPLKKMQIYCESRKYKGLEYGNYGAVKLYFFIKSINLRMRLYSLMFKINQRRK